MSKSPVCLALPGVYLTEIQFNYTKITAFHMLRSYIMSLDTDKDCNTATMGLWTIHSQHRGQ